MPDNFSFRGSGFSSLGNSLSSAINSYSRLEALENQREAERADIQNFNQMQTEYMNTVNELTSRYGNRLTSTSIKRMAYNQVTERWQNSGIPISDFSAAASRMNNENPITTFTDTIINTAKELQLVIDSPRFESDARYREDMVSTVMKASRAHNYIIQETLDDNEAALVTQDFIDTELTVLSEKYSSLKSLKDNGDISTDTYSNEVSKIFNFHRERLSGIAADLSRKGKEVSGQKLFALINDLNSIENTIKTNSIEMERLNMALQQERELSKLFPLEVQVKKLDLENRYSLARIKNKVISNKDMQKAFILSEIMGSTGLTDDLTMGNQLTEYVTSGWNTIKSDLDSFSSDAIKFMGDNPQYRDAFDSIFYQSYDEDSANRAATSLMHFVNDTLDEYDKIIDPNTSNSDMADLLSNYISRAYILTASDLLFEAKDYLNEVSKKYPNNINIKQAIEGLNQITQNFDVTLDEYKKQQQQDNEQKEKEIKKKEGKSVIKTIFPSILWSPKEERSPEIRRMINERYSHGAPGILETLDKSFNAFNQWLKKDLEKEPY